MQDFTVDGLRLWNLQAVSVNSHNVQTCSKSPSSDL